MSKRLWCWDWGEGGTRGEQKVRAVWDGPMAVLCLHAPIAMFLHPAVLKVMILCPSRPLNFPPIYYPLLSPPNRVTPALFSLLSLLSSLLSFAAVSSQPRHRRVAILPPPRRLFLPSSSPPPSRILPPLAQPTQPAVSSLRRIHPQPSLVKERGIDSQGNGYRQSRKWVSTVKERGIDSQGKGYRQ